MIQQWTPSSNRNNWAPSSQFVSSSIPSWQILTAHAQPFSGARDLAFCLKVPLDSLLVWASSGGSGETARMRRLAWTFAARIGDKHILSRRLYQNMLNFFSAVYYLITDNAYQWPCNRASLWHPGDLSGLGAWSPREAGRLSRFVSWSLSYCPVSVERSQFSLFAPKITDNDKSL